MKKTATHLLFTFLLVTGVFLSFLNATTLTGSAAQTEQTAGNPPKAPSGLLTELMPHPLAVENLKHPHFSWIVNDSDRGERQTAYEIRVGTDPDQLLKGNSVFWDSGKIDSAQSSSVPYDGPKLDPATRYFWTVRTWDKHDVVSQFADPAMFGTALKDQWSAFPIWETSNEYSSWDNYTLEADVTIEKNAAGIEFRAKDQNNTYMWQLSVEKGGLAPHVKVSGSWKQIGLVKYPFETGEKYHVKIKVNGKEITTFIDGEQIDKRMLSDYMSGSIGVRTGSRESFYIDNVQVTSNEDKTLYSEDFSDDNGGLGCGSVKDGRLYVGNSNECIIGGSDDWVFLRKAFQLADKPIAHATAYATAVSPDPANQYVYRLYLNGQFVGVGPTRGYDGKTFYNAFDVTKLLRRGKQNALGVIAYTSKGKKFLLELHITYRDGTQKVIGTDKTWKGMNGSRVYPPAGNIGTGYYFAPRENIQAKAYPFGFSKPGFKASSKWSGVSKRKAIPNLFGLPTRNLKQYSASPVRVVKKGPGHYFLDFGHTVVGGIRLPIHSDQGGQVVEIRLGEELKAPNTVRFRMRTGNTYRDFWTLKKGDQVLQHWGYRVFRYAEIIGLPDSFDISNVTAVGLRYPFNKHVSEFHSSNENLNKVWQFTKHSIRDLNLGLYVDSPTRERNPYEADAYIQQMSNYALDRGYALARLSIQYLYHKPTWPTEWKEISIMSAWQDYLFTGDPSSLSRNYELLKKKALDEYMTPQGYVKKSTNNDIVDWPASERDGYVFTKVNTVVNAYNYKDLVDLSKIAKVLGYEQDAAHYAQLAKQERQAISDSLFNSDLGRFRDGLGVDHYAVHASIFPVALGAATEKQAASATKYIAKRGMVCSVYCAPFLLESLFRNGFSKKAVDLLTAETTHSWMHMIQLGAGSTMEAWDPSIKPNLTYSHAWAASPSYIVPRELFGIKPTRPAFSQFEIKPRPGGVKQARMTVPTIKGSIHTAFKRTDGKFHLTVKIPANTTATVYIPAKNKWAVTESGQWAYTKRQIKFIDIEDGNAVFKVGSGTYHFVSDPLLGKLGTAQQKMKDLQNQTDHLQNKGRLSKGKSKYLMAKTKKLIKQIHAGATAYLEEDNQTLLRELQHALETVGQLRKWVQHKISPKTAKMLKQPIMAVDDLLSSVSGDLMGVQTKLIPSKNEVLPGETFNMKAVIQNTGDENINGVDLNFKAPEGWKVIQLDTNKAGVLHPDHKFTVSFKVTVPKNQAITNEVELTGTAHYRKRGGAVELPLTSTLRVISPVEITSLQADPNVIEPGGKTTLHVTVRNKGVFPLEEKVRLLAPEKWHVKPETKTIHVEVGKEQTVAFEVQSSEQAKKDAELQAQVSYGKGVGDKETTTVYLAIPLKKAFNNIGISNDDNPSAADYTGNGKSYSAQALAEVGLTPGAQINYNGFTFTWPDVPVNKPDNVVAGGQTIKISSSGDMLGFLGASAFGNASGQGKIIYTDGTTQSFTLTFTDWWSTSPVEGNELVAATLNQGGHKVSVNFAAIPLEKDKVVEAVKLPNISQGVADGATAMHIFSMDIK